VQCPIRSSPTRTPRIEEVATRRLVEKFSTERTDSSHDGAGDPRATAPPTDSVAAERTGERVTLSVDGETVALDREDAAALRDDLAAALTDRTEYVHTAGEHRADGAYVVERRGADSAGHRKVFEDFAACRRLFERLPATATAEDVTRTGVTGGRRHMLLRHFAEHPAFDCTLTARQPLTVEKR